MLDCYFELEGEHEHLLQFLYSFPIGLAEITADGTIGMMNPFAMKLLLPIARTPQTDNFFAIMEPYAPELRNMLDGFASLWGAVCENHRIVVSPHTKEGDHEANVLSCTLVKLKSWHYIVTLADVSTQVAQERRLQQAETWFASLLDGVEHFAIVSLDAQGTISAVNRSVARQTGLSASQTVGQTLEIFDVPGPASSAITVNEQIALASRDGWHLTECWQIGLGGKPYWCQRLIAVRSGDEETSESSISGYTFVLREVLNRHADFGKLTLMLTQDFLTGASNRARFFDLAELECARSRRYGQPLALIGLDLDHFKRVNDTYGHGAGDAVLKSISRECKALLRQSDTFARVGGEEFFVLLPSTDMQHAANSPSACVPSSPLPRSKSAARLCTFPPASAAPQRTRPKARRPSYLRQPTKRFTRPRNPDVIGSSLPITREAVGVCTPGCTEIIYRKRTLPYAKTRRYPRCCRRTVLYCRRCERDVPQDFSGGPSRSKRSTVIFTGSNSYPFVERWIAWTWSIRGVWGIS